MQNSKSRKETSLDNLEICKKPDKIANAIPMTITFVFLSLLTFIGQNFLSNRKPPVNTILLADEQSEQNIETETSTLEVALKPIDIDQANHYIDQYLLGSISNTQLIIKINNLNTKIQQADKKMFNLIIQTFVKEKKYQRILQLLEKFSDKQLSINHLDFTYSLILSKTENKIGAIRHFKKILKQQPNHQASLVNLGLLYLQQKRYQDATNLFEQGLTFASGSHKAKIFAGLADAKLALGSLHKAVTLYKKSIEYRPTHSLTWRKLARAESQLKLPNNVVMLSYQKALALSPKNSSILKEYSQYLFSKMKYKMVTNLLKKNLVQSKASIKLRILLIISYIERKHLSNARKQLNLLKSHATRKIDKKIIKGLDFYLKRNYEELISVLKTTLKKNRDNFLAYYFIARGYQRNGKPKNALIYFNKVRHDSLFFNTSQFRAGLAYIAVKDSAKAEKIFNLLFLRLPQNDEIAYSVAKLAYDKKNYAVAYAAISRGLLTFPNNKHYGLLEAKIRWRLGERDKVLMLLKSIIDRYPNFKPAIYRQADFLMQQGKAAAAKEPLSRLLEIDPDYSNVQIRLAKIYFSNNKTKALSLPLIESYLQRKNSDIKARAFYARVLCSQNLKNECQKQLELIKMFDHNNKEVETIESFYF